MHATSDTDLYLRLRSTPVIEHSVGVRVAPYAPAYPGAAADLAAHGMEEEAGQWAQVQDFGWLRAAASPNWHVLAEDERAPPPSAGGA